MKNNVLNVLLCLFLILFILSCPNNDDENQNGDNSKKTGNLSFGGSYSNLIIDTPRDVAVSSDGKHVYVISQYQNAIAWFTRNSNTGELTYRDRYYNDDIEDPYSVAISYDGDHVYVTASSEDAVAWFSRNNTTGDLSYIDRYKDAVITTALSITISPDDSYVYVGAAVSAIAGTVAWFSRNPTTGALTYINNYTNQNIELPRSLIISDDGDFAYVAACQDEDAIAWFSRNNTTGDLSYINRYASSSNIGNPFSITLSPDNNHLYAASNDTNAVSWFTRNDLSGDLNYIDQYSSTDPETGIIEASGVAVSPDGNHVYVVAFNSDAIAWFSRNTITSSLTYKGRHALAELNGAYAVDISPDGNHVYVVSSIADSVTWFTRN